MAEEMSQDSDTGLTAAQLEAKYGDLEDGSKTPPKVDDTPPAWLDEAAAILNNPTGPSANNPPAAAPGAPPAPLMPVRSKTSQLVEQMGALAASAPSAAPPDNKPAGPSKTAAPGGKPGGEDDDTSADDSDDDELTAEEKEKAELVKNINEVIARAKAQGYTFSSRSETTAAAAFLDAKDLFDADGLDITDCASDNKKISLSVVNKKVTELRAAEQASLAVVDTTASQLQLGDDDSDEEEEEPQFNPHKDKTLAQIKPLLIDAKGELFAAMKVQKGGGPIGAYLLSEISAAKKKYGKGSNEHKDAVSECKVLQEFQSSEFFRGLGPMQLTRLSAVCLSKIEEKDFPEKVIALQQSVDMLKKLHDAKIDEAAEAKKRKAEDHSDAAALTPGKMSGKRSRNA